jgi:hypothetical protein
MEDDEPLCLVCADLDHLAYLPAGDAALTAARGRPAACRQWWCASAGPGSATSARGSLSSSGRWPRHRAWQTQRRAPAAVPAMRSGGAKRTARSPTGWPRRSGACSPDARRSAPPRSPPTPQRVAAGGSAAPPGASAWMSRRSSWRWWPPSATTTPTTTRCSWSVRRGARPGSGSAGARRFAGALLRRADWPAPTQRRRKPARSTPRPRAGRHLRRGAPAPVDRSRAPYSGPPPGPLVSPSPASRPRTGRRDNAASTGQPMAPEGCSVRRQPVRRSLHSPARRPSSSPRESTSRARKTLATCRRRRGGPSPGIPGSSSAG